MKFTLCRTGTEQIRSLTRHFDHLIREATVSAHDSAGFVRGLQVG
jgi:hypothetical protein